MDPPDLRPPETTRECRTCKKAYWARGEIRVLLIFTSAIRPTTSMTFRARIIFLRATGRYAKRPGDSFRRNKTRPRYRMDRRKLARINVRCYNAMCYRSRIANIAA